MNYPAITFKNITYYFWRLPGGHYCPFCQGICDYSYSTYWKCRNCGHTHSAVPQAADPAPAG